MHTFFNKITKHFTSGAMPSEEELTQLYRNMTIQELQRLNPKELTYIALQCYRQELQRRRELRVGSLSCPDKPE